MATIRKLPSGSWQVQVRRKGESPTSKTFSSKNLAEQWARSIENQIDRGIFVDRTEAERTTLGELIDRYLLEITPNKKGEKQERYRLLAIKKQIGHHIIGAIQSKHIASYRDSRINEGLASATVLRELADLSHLFNIAVKDWGFPLNNNPVLQIRKPAKAKGRDRRLTAAELERLLVSLNETKEVVSIVQLAIETGMRRTEILKLEWSNINLQKRVAWLPDTKNGESRTVPLSRTAIRLLEQLPRNQKTVFTTRPDSVSQAFHRACLSAKRRAKLSRVLGKRALKSFHPR
ncbi:MAG: site-specific integrase [Methylomonas sp.]|jgi:integrase|uniref:tyrosine-type recombinase/integrase n=1 Tax=Methylomonas sp. TaxID=418 RepID=UPI0025E078E8|nr:integrase [Methylomonas sp.]MCK9608642.1 site-specific integrase [Methylomonas sp.]